MVIQLDQVIQTDWDNMSHSLSPVNQVANCRFVKMTSTDYSTGDLVTCNVNTKSNTFAVANIQVAIAIGIP